MSAVAVPHLPRYIFELSQVDDGLDDFVDIGWATEGVIEPALSLRKHIFGQIGFLPTWEHEVYSDILGPPL